MDLLWVLLSVLALIFVLVVWIMWPPPKRPPPPISFVDSDSAM